MSDTAEKQVEEKPHKIILALDTNALIALIGGDSEIEMVLRKAAVENFARRYLKGIANDEIMQIAVQMVRKTIRDQEGQIKQIVSEEIYKSSYGTALNDKTRGHIKDRIKSEINCLVSDAAVDARKNINEEVKAAFARLTKDVEEYVVRRLPEAEAKMVERVINERLGEISKLINSQVASAESDQLGLAHEPTG